MAIPVHCPQCDRPFQVNDAHAGKRGRCPYCRGVIQVPALSPPGDGAVAKTPPEQLPRRRTSVATAASIGGGAPAASSGSPDLPKRRPEDLEADFLGAFQGEIPRVRVSLAYRLAILLVALFMVILPLVYVALIGLAGYGVYLHAVHDTALLGLGVGRGRIVAVLLYAAPLVVGAILVLFMIKPLFAPPADRPRTRSLTPNSDPLLFAFVDRVCAAVRAPAPRRIDVDCQVNASARFRRGLLSMLGSDLVLTIGMPLAAGLSLRQFAGVLAHEFGHFSQGAGMRLTYVIRSISFWFTRVVYQRDGWDERLVRWSQNTDWRVAIILLLARLCVWLTRRILWVLMIVGHVVSALMLRQMEFDADRYEARLVGSDTFESTARRLLVLAVADRGAQSDLGTFYREGRLGDNLPRLIMANVEQIPAEVHARINEMLDQSRTGLLDTHPADKQRIANAWRENAPGVFRLDRPASVLFANFEAACRNVTWDFYRAIFGPKFQPADMHPMDDLLARQSQEEETGKALGRFFQGPFHALRPLPLPREPLGPPAEPKQCAGRVKAERQRMLELRSAYDKAYAVYDQADTRALEADQARAILAADLKVPSRLFAVPLTDSTTVARVRREAVAQQDRVTAELVEFEKSAATRLRSALELLHVPRVAARIRDAEEKQKQCARFLSAVNLLTDVAPTVLSLRNEHASLGVLLGNLQGNFENRHLVRTVGKAMHAVGQHLENLRRRLRTAPYPLDHAKADISIGEYMLAELPPADDLGAVFEAGRQALETLPILYVRLVARLVAVAEEVEKVLGLERLPAPPEDGCG